MLSYYGRLSSEVYNMDKPVGHSFGDIEFYAERLKSCKGPVLEPAAGTGRMLIPLLEKGFHVEGFDSSKDMLGICHENCKKRGLDPKLFEGKMETFSLDNFYEHLSDGGRLIVDIFLQNEISTGIVSTRTWECPNGDIITLENKIVKVDYINQYTISHGRYEKWRDGVLLQTELEYFPLRWYGVEEFRLVLESIGFKDIKISSDYKLGKYPSSSEDMITFEAIAAK